GAFPRKKKGRAPSPAAGVASLPLTPTPALPFPFVRRTVPTDDTHRTARGAAVLHPSRAPPGRRRQDELLEQLHFERGAERLAIDPGLFEHRQGAANLKIGQRKAAQLAIDSVQRRQRE